MAPKKSKPQPRTDHNSGSSSQPLEPARQTRAAIGRKRKASDLSLTSDRPSSSHSIPPASSTASTPAKRRKRTKSNRTQVEPERAVILEEDEDQKEQEQQEDADTDELSHDKEDAAVDSTKHVHFPSVRQSQVMVQESGKTTATHITPHPRKMALKRRTTTSSSVAGEALGGVKVTSTRHPLPPSLSREQGQAGHVEEGSYQFAPLHQVLEDRKKLRSSSMGPSRVARIQELEAQKQTASDDEAEDIEAALAELRAECNDDAVDKFMGDDMLVLESRGESIYPELPGHAVHGEFDERKLNDDIVRTEEQTLSQIQRRSREAAWDSEREEFRDAILALSRQANEANTRLEILEIELRSLGLGEGFDSGTVLVSIRESFVAIRESLEAILPGSIPDDVSNQDIIEILVANVKEFVGRLRVQDAELQNKDSLITDLGNQIKSLLDRLADTELRNDLLNEQHKQLDEEIDTKEREIYDRDVRLAELEEERDILHNDLEVKTTEAEGLGQENTELQQSIQTLTQSLAHYRDEETKLTALITKMEEEHTTTLTKMNAEREETVQDLENRLDEQSQGRSQAELLSVNHQTTINHLELRIGALEQERVKLREQLADKESQLEEESEARESAEADLEEKGAEIDSLTMRVDKLEVELTELNAQLEELRQLHETEREQRETAEAGLDRANDEVDELNEKLNAQGTQANGLRQKLFEVQQYNEQRIKDLEANASERDQQFQIDIQDEILRRETAEDDVQDREETIAELRSRLETLELKMVEDLAERDARTAALQQEIVDKKGEIEDLTADLLSTEQRHQSEKAQSQQDKEDLENSIAALNSTVAEHEEDIARLQQEVLNESALHSSDIEDKNATIAELNHEVAMLKSTVMDLESANTGLERRVEAEAEQMLQLQAEKADEVQALRDVISDKQNKIQVVELKAHEADQRWQDVLTAREEEIASLHAEQSSSEETVMVLNDQIEDMKRIFRAFIESTDARLEARQVEIEALHDTAQSDTEAAKQLGMRRLAEFEEYGNMSQNVITKAVVHSSQAQEQVTRKTRSKKKRAMDSGIGLDGEDELTIAM